MIIERKIFFLERQHQNICKCFVSRVIYIGVQNSACFSKCREIKNYKYNIIFLRHSPGKSTTFICFENCEQEYQKSYTSAGRRREIEKILLGETSGRKINVSLLSLAVIVR
jgi:hypothetical protein